MARGEDGSRIVTFLGDVVITHGELTATGDQARYLETLRRAVLSGDVTMVEDSTTVRGPFATYDRENGVARFPDGVSIERPSGTADAKTGTWRREEGRVRLLGDASAKDSAGTVEADTITYILDEEMFHAAGDARWTDAETGTFVRGQSLTYERGVPRAYATGDPEAVFRDDEDVDVHVSSDRMTYDPSTKEAVATGDVRIRRESMEAACGTAIFYRGEDRAVLLEDPEMVDGPTVVRGDRIEMLAPEPGRRIVRVRGGASVANRFLEERVRPEAPREAPPAAPSDTADTTASQLPGATEAPAGAAVSGAPDTTKAAAADSAAAEPEGDPLPDWLRTPSDRLPRENLLFGDEITMHFVEDDLDRVVVIGHGRSKFFPNEDVGELSEWNDVVGDTLRVWFTDSDVDSVHVLGEGNGQYRFPAGDLEGRSPDELRSAGKLVDYRAPRVRYVRGEETMHLDGGAQVTYKTMTLRSGTIDFDAEREIMTASGDPSPVLVDREDEFHGTGMNYHMPSGKGEIREGRTSFQGGYYGGRDVWKMGDDVLAVDHARYTTCDQKSPHYHFDCRHMKIYLDDKMVARPVVLRIRNIPVFALPFYMTSLRKDRHSGFLLPNLELGVDDARGRFIRNMGYYWAPNDYTDLTATADFYPSREQIVGYLTGRYHARYRFQGEARLKYSRDGSVDRRESAVELRHTHEIDPSTRVVADARFLSSSSFYQDIDDAQRLNRDLRSHATLTRRFEGSRNLLVEVTRQENLDTGALTETLPRLSFTNPSTSLGGRKPGAPGEEEDGSWLDDVYLKVDGRAVNHRRVSTDASEEKHAGSTIDGRLTSTQDLFRYLRISPSGSFETTWIDEDRTGRRNPLRATYQGSLTARTDIYGTFLKPVGPVRGFRHVIRPSVSWNWAPEFREYFFADSSGNLQDRFFSFGGIGGTPRKAHGMNLGVGNLLQTKVARDERESRYDLFNLSTAIRYNFQAAEQGDRPWSTLTNSLTVLSAAPVNQSWSVAHNPYTWNLLSSSVTTRATLGSHMFREEQPRRPGPDQGGVPDLYGSEWGDPVGGGRGTGPRIGETFTPGEWSAQISHTSNHTPSTGQTSSHLVLNGTWSPTARWHVRFDYNYDLEEGKNTSQSFSVQRTIHCWDLTFDRRLLGGEWQYHIRIAVTDLPDLQLERGDRSAGRGFGTPGIPGF